MKAVDLKHGSIRLPFSIFTDIHMGRLSQITVKGHDVGHVCFLPSTWLAPASG